MAAPGAADLGLRQRRERAPRRGLPPAARPRTSRGCPRTRCRSATSRTASTPAAASSRDMAGLFDRYLGPTGRAAPASPRPGRGSTRSPTRSCGRTHERRRERLVVFARRRLAPPARAARGLRPRHRPGPRRPQHARPHHRLRPPLRHLQARRPHPAATWSGSRPSCSTAERPVQVIFAGKAHPKDHEGKDVLKAVVQRLPARGAPPPPRLHRGLRPGRRPLPRAGRRRVAQHPAARHGGQRHLGHEGRPQRRPQPEHPRRLVVRGLPARGGLGHRQGRGLRRPRLPGHRRVERALRPPRERRGAALLRARGGRPARAPGSPA